jgi:hypothetical protein
MIVALVFSYFEGDPMSIALTLMLISLRELILELDGQRDFSRTADKAIKPMKEK